MKDVEKLLGELAGNVRWIWNGEFDPLFREIDAVIWEKVNHNPTAFLMEVSPEKLQSKSQDVPYCVRLERACRSLHQYVQDDNHWIGRQSPGLAARPVSYFSAEFGLHESLPIYSGGLGILAGDHLKSASDLGLPIWGITILYRNGYFFQEIDASGQQHETYQELDTSRVPIERAQSREGEASTLKIELGDSHLKVDLWRTRVGRANLLLLDGYGGPIPEDRFAYTRRLYGGDLQTRLVQEIVLGVGGYRGMKEIGLRPSVIHMNEGHSAFAVLEAVADRMEEEGLSFVEATERVREQTVFTTHTPVPAGHDRFPPELMEQHLRPLRTRLKLSSEEFLALGRVDPKDKKETFCMTVLALKLANSANGVSTLHGRVSRRMWKELWPGRTESEVPIGHITNGVHIPSWIAPSMAKFFDRCLAPDWERRLCDRQAWRKILETDPFEVWDAKSAVKQELITFANQRLESQRARRGESGEERLNPKALTIGFGRRIVRYKRPTLIFRDQDRIAKLLNDPDRPVQIVFAGKAHPHDDAGKELLRDLHGLTQDPRFKGKVFYLENYDMNVGRTLVQGCDLWLNNPRRPFEACGTSGMKAVINGTLNLSILDGWWAEAYDKRNGYAFGRGMTHSEEEMQDQRDAEELIWTLENRVIPDFYDRSPEGVPLKWVGRIQRAMATLACRYNSDRMVQDYVNHCYLLLSGSRTSHFPK